MEKKEKTLTLRLPDSVLQEMREQAERHTRSLNSEVLVALRAYLMHQTAKKGQGLKPERA